jgi:hypothetical protein
MVPVWIEILVKAVVLWILIILLLLFGVISKMWGVVLICYMIYVYYYKTGLSAQDHGSINRAIFIGSGFLICLIYVLLKITLKVIRNNEKLFVMIVMTLASVIFYLYYMRFHHS